MANAIQLRRGTTAEHSTFTGLVGEVTVDTTKDTIVVHDGTTAGGVPLAKESDIPAALTASEILTSISTVDGAGSGLDADTIDGKQLATIESEYQAYANSAAAAVVDAAPATLDTLNELAAALGDDPNFATTVTNSIASKLPLAGGTLTGTLNGTNISLSGTISGSYISLHPDVTTISAATTQTLDMNKPMSQVTMTAATAFSAINVAAGRTAIVHIDRSASGHSPTWSADIKWPDATEPTWADNRYWVISMTCWNSTSVFASATGHTI